jgi:glycosyltransferase involved in cell wall biosynthesis
MPLISVLIPCYNAVRWIGNTLESVVLQEVPDLEVIVIDDGSDDGSADFVERNFSQVRVFRTSNEGASAARNRGLAESSGTFIQFLDADDLLAPGKIKLQVSALQETGADVAYGDWQRLVQSREGEFVKGEIVAREFKREPELELFSNFWCPPAAYLFRRSITEATGGWNRGLRIIQDARFALDCAMQGAKFVYCRGIVAYYRMHGDDSLSRRDPIAFTRDVFKNTCEVEEWWKAHGGLSDERIRSLMDCFEHVARASYEHDRPLFELACSSLSRFTSRYAPTRPLHMALVSRLVGYRGAEAIALRYRRAKRFLRSRRRPRIPAVGKVV